MHDWIPLE